MKKKVKCSLWRKLIHLALFFIFIIVILTVDELIGFRRVVKAAYKAHVEDPYSVNPLPCHYLQRRSDSPWAEDVALQIRVWIREKSLRASAAAHVRDFRNGTYAADIRVLWAGRVEILASLISPRETIAINFRRRFKCPQTVHNVAVFQHPKEDIVEETLCNTEPFIPGYDVVCNLTLENYGHAWYCGKPKNHRLLCNDWSVVNDKNMWNYGLEQIFLNDAEKFLVNTVNKAAIFPEQLEVFVSKAPERIVKCTCTKCCDISLASTWNRTSPIGHFFKNKWVNSQCRGPPNDDYLVKCLSNATVLLIGDSTLRQFHAGIQKKLPCLFITDSWSKAGKHRPVTCYNATLNFTLTWAPHGLPFSTKGTPRQYLRPIGTYLDQLKREDSNYIVVIHTYAHLLSYHSSVFKNLMKTVRKSVEKLLTRNPGIKIFIKGPHSWAFEKAAYQTMWMIDAYAKVYQDIIHEEFRGLQDKVMYLDCLDMTIADENNNIHASENTVEQIIDQMFHHVCPY